MKRNENLTEVISPGALYSYAMMELDSYIDTVNNVENELQTTIKELNMIISSSKKLEGLDSYVQNIFVQKFYLIKDYFFHLRHVVKNYDKKLEQYFMREDGKRDLFQTKVKYLESLIAQKELFVDTQLERCDKYIERYNTDLTV